MFDVSKIASMLLSVILPIPIPPALLEIGLSFAITTVIRYQMSLGNEQTHQLLSTTKWIKQLFSSFNTLKNGTHFK